jgi:phage-related protein
MATFTWTPDFGASAGYKPRVRVAKFGDGYEQRVADGINTGQDEWSLRFSVRDDLETGAILAFLNTRAGAEAFDWTPPGAIDPIRVVCREWSRSFDRNDQNTVTLKFNRVYEL